MKRLILAHDLGTSGDKAALFSDEGRLVASASASYGTRYPRGSWAEQEPEDWWRAVAEATRRVMAGADPREIAAIGFSGQMMGCVCVDRAGRALRPAIIYSDQRAVEEAAALLEGIGGREFYAVTGHRASASYSAEKLMWLMRHEPRTYARTAAMLHAKDYLNLRLTGEVRSEFSDASGTNLLDLGTLAWSEHLVKASGLDGEKLPRLVRSTEVVGELTKAAADELGLVPGIPVVAGGGDGVCAGVGAGSVRPGATYNYLGSSSWIATTTEAPVLDPAMRTFTFAHAVPGAYHPCGTMQTAGSAYAWARDALCGIDTAAAAAELGPDSFASMDARALRSPPGARGLVFLPHLLGERSPRWNPEATGAFLGLGLRHGREDLLRAVLEGVAMNLSIVLGILREAVPIPAILAIGGGAAGTALRRILADVYGIPILRPEHLEEATSVGAAVIAGVGCGLFRDFSVAERFLSIVDRTEPDPSTKEAYRKAKARFEDCYRALEPLFPELGKD